MLCMGYLDFFFFSFKLMEKMLKYILYKVIQNNISLFGNLFLSMLCKSVGLLSRQTIDTYERPGRIHYVDTILCM